MARFRDSGESRLKFVSYHSRRVGKPAEFSFHGEIATIMNGRVDKTRDYDDATILDRMAARRKPFIGNHRVVPIVDASGATTDPALATMLHACLQACDFLFEKESSRPCDRRAKALRAIARRDD